MMSRDGVHGYWRSPGPDNAPAGYVEGRERTDFLIGLVQRHAVSGATVLEIGCNVGRNLNALARAGYRVSGVEINPAAVALLRATYPLLAGQPVTVGPIEEVIGTLGTFDMIVTMAVLEHLHPDSEWVFGEMAQRGRLLVTVEDEHGTSSRHCPRDYGAVFGGLGRTEVEALSCRDVPGLGPDFMARVFR